MSRTTSLYNKEFWFQLQKSTPENQLNWKLVEKEIPYLDIESCSDSSCWFAEVLLLDDVVVFECIPNPKETALLGFFGFLPHFKGA